MANSRSKTSTAVTREILLGLDLKQLKRLMENGHPIDPTKLDNTQYNGISLGLPHWVEQLTWKKFKKVFHRDPATGWLRGWNVKVKQNGLDEPWEEVTEHGKPVAYGFYRVEPAEGHAMPLRARQGLMINYGEGGNPALSPLSALRDPVVALEKDNVTRLLGMSYLDLGLFQAPTPSYFLLERGDPLEVVARP